MKIKCSDVQFAEIVVCPCCGGETSENLGLAEDLQDEYLFEIPNNTPIDKIESVAHELLEKEIDNNIQSFDYEITIDESEWYHLYELDELEDSELQEMGFCKTE